MQTIWSIAAALLALSAVGIYIVKPGFRKKESTPPPPPPKDNLTTSGERIVNISTSKDNVNLRLSASTRASNIIATIPKSGSYIGTLIEYVPDNDDDQKPAWAHVQPKSPFNTVDTDFFVSTDFIKAT